MHGQETREITLSHKEILALHAAAVQAGLPASRSALLRGLAPELVASLPDAATPAGQCLSDLVEISRVGRAEGGSAPVAIWLRNALALAGFGPDARVFEEALARMDPRDLEEDRDLRRASFDDWDERLLAQVERICKLRQPAATISRRRAPVPFAGALEVNVAHGPIVVTELVGALDHVINDEALEIFTRKVDAPYRANAPALRTTLVHGGPASPLELAQRAYRSGILLTSFTEYQGLLDFSRYLAWQTRRLEGDIVYPPSLYVEQSATVSIGGREETSTESALSAMWDLLESPHPRFALILGDFGAGKTFLLHELARRMAVEKHPLVPVLVEMRALEKQRSLGALIAQHFASADVGRMDVDAFRYMLAEGRIALLFDGFDELALRLSYDRALEHFDTLVEAAKGSAKVVVTSRTQHFLTEHQVKRALAERAEQIPGYRLVTIQPFGRAQIRQFLVNRLGDEREAEARLALLEEVKDLLGLSKVPRLLGFIAEIEPEKLQAAKEQAGEITSAKLYEVLIDRWLDGEHTRVNPRGAPRGIPRAGLRAAVTEIALRLWGQTGRTLSREELAVIPVPGAEAIDASVLAHQLGSGSLLVRDEEGAFSFLHQSVMEWLVADAAAKEVGRGEDPAVLRADAMSDLMADFFAALATPGVAKLWAGQILQGGESGHAKENALRVLRRLPRGEVGDTIVHGPVHVIEGPMLAGEDLAGRDLTGADLRKADLTGANLWGATLVGAKLEAATLARAKLARTDLRDADLRGADLSDADLSFAVLRGADLRGAKLAGANVRAAKLVGTRIDPFPSHPLALLEVSGAAISPLSRAEPMLGPASGCNDVAWSPCGDLLLTGHEDGTLRLSDAITGRTIRVLTGHNWTIRSVAFSPDGQLIASGSWDKTVRIWEASSGRILHTLTGHVSMIQSIAFSPNGKLIASGSWGKTVRIWEVSSGSMVRALNGHRGAVQGLAFSPDSETLVSGSRDATIRLWDVSSGCALRTFEGHTAAVQSVAFSPAGKMLASGSEDTTIRLWEVSSGHVMRTLEAHGGAVQSVAFDSEGDMLASASEDATVRLWEVTAGRLRGVLEGHQGGVPSVAFDPRGEVLASASRDGTVRLWGVVSGRTLGTVDGHRGAATSVAFDPRGRMLAAGALDDSVRLWEVSTGRMARTFESHIGRIESIAFDPEGAMLAAGSTLWNVSTGRVVRVFEGHRGPVQCVAFDPEGKTLASGSGDETVRLWEVSSGRLLRVLEGHTHWVQSVAFSPAGEILASASYDKTICLWDVRTGHLVHMCEGHASPVRSVAFDPEGGALASGSGDKTIRLWMVRNGCCLHTLNGHAGAVHSVAFSPDGKVLASGSGDETVRLWSMSTMAELCVLEGHLGSVRQVAFHPSGRFLASASADGTIRVWDLTTRACLAILLTTPEGWAAFTPDGRYKIGGDIAGSFWHVIGLCRFEPGELDADIPGLRLADDAPLLTLS